MKGYNILVRFLTVILALLVTPYHAYMPGTIMYNASQTPSLNLDLVNVPAGTVTIAIDNINATFMIYGQLAMRLRPLGVSFIVSVPPNYVVKAQFMSRFSSCNKGMFPTSFPTGWGMNLIDATQGSELV